MARAAPQVVGDRESGFVSGNRLRLENESRFQSRGVAGGGFVSGENSISVADVGFLGVFDPSEPDLRPRNADPRVGFVSVSVPSNAITSFLAAAYRRAAVSPQQCLGAGQCPLLIGTLLLSPSERH